MRKKALIVGALPSAFEGPWVKIDECRQWRIVPSEDFDRKVVVEVQSESGLERIYLHEGTDSLIAGKLARAVVREGAGNGSQISVLLEEFRGRVQR